MREVYCSVHRTPSYFFAVTEVADVQTKATETLMRGATMMQKGLEGSKMAAEAGSDLAQSGKADKEITVNINTESFLAHKS